jgi:hypothetical protein
MTPSGIEPATFRFVAQTTAAAATTTTTTTTNNNNNNKNKIILSYFCVKTDTT